VGCGSDDGEDTNTPERVEFLTFWGKGGELNALDALIDVHVARRPNAEVTKSVEDDFAAYDARLTERINNRNPPDTFQSNQGRRLTKWVLFNNVDDTQSKLEPVTSLGDEEKALIPADLLKVNSFNGDLYAVPVGIIRQNSFYYNVQLLEDHNIDVEAMKQPGRAGVEGLLAACETLAAADINCLAMGNVNDWILDMFLWENLFPAMVGADYYRAFWEGAASPTDQEVTDTLNMMLELYKYIDPENTEIDFPDSLKRLFNEDNQAAMVQMGDWGTGMYLAEGHTPGGDVGVMPFPGTADIFMFSSDVVPIAKGSQNTKAAQEFLKTIATAEAQSAFNKFKGSLPARRDASIEGFTEAQIDTRNHLYADGTKQVPVVHGFKPDSIMNELPIKAKQMVAEGDISVVQNYLEANYQSLVDLPR